MISTLLLFYSAITSSINAGFYWTAPSCFKTPTLEIDMAVDLFFVIEIILHFFEGVYRQGQYHDDLVRLSESAPQMLQALFEFIYSVAWRGVGCLLICTPCCYFLVHFTEPAKLRSGAFLGGSKS